MSSISLNLDDLLEDGDGLYQATKENIVIARKVAMNGWTLRARERGLDDPSDLSSACKFCSLFARALFGGEIRGNEAHQFLVLPDGSKLDLGAGSRDIEALDDPHHHDPFFWSNPDHIDSMESCLPRVAGWVSDFEASPLRTTEIEVGISELLNFVAHPLDGDQWDEPSFEVEDIAAALARPRRETVSWQEAIRRDEESAADWHLARIAHLVENPATDAIRLSVERVDDDEVYIDLIDGYHRLAAAIFREENSILASVPAIEVDFVRAAAGVKGVEADQVEIA